MTDDTSDETLRICHCGWSKVTSYQGLRTHQGMMGCTPKGMHIPESERSRYLPERTVSTPPLIKVNKPLTDVLAASAKSAVATPQRRPQSTAKNPDEVPWALDFSIFAQQVEQLWTTGEERFIRVKDEESEKEWKKEKERRREKEIEAQKLVQVIRDRKRADLQQKIHLRENKMAEVRSSAAACKATLDAEWMEIDDVFSETDSMSLQTCSCCGWSKVTSYQGLRTHQGKMGCTPKGMHIPESQRFSLPKWTCSPSVIQLNPPFIFSPSLESVFETPPRYPHASTRSNNARRALDFSADALKTDDTSDETLRICHCGWSKVTSYQGLRTHQGMMGCTPKGMHIPESERSRYLPERTISTPPLIKVNEPPTDVLAASAKSAVATPQRHPQSTAKNPDEVPWALDFSIFAQQVEQLWTTGEERFIRVKDEESEKEWKKEKEKRREKEIEAQKLVQVIRDRKRADLQQKIHLRENKMAEVRSSAAACKATLDAEWMEIDDVFSEVMRVVEESRQEALRPLEERRQKVKREEQDLIQNLQRETDALRQTMEELEKNPNLQVPPAEPDLRTKVHVDTSLSFSSLRATTSTMMKQIQHKLENLCSVELRRIPSFAVDVKLDPSTAHHCLVLSDDGKTVRDGGKKPKPPDAPQRFDMYGSVLALNSLTRGKSYWEVEVANKTGWDLGVARRNANRKGVLTLSPDSGYWVTVHYEDEKYAALSAPPVSLSLAVKPQRVGVFVDYEDGLVSFYDVENQSHIYSFTECLFGDAVVPYFSPHLDRDGENVDPLVISAVQ